MPFEHNLIHPDEPPLTPAGDIDLPDDLVALAEQLADDSAHLATCYPADLALRAGSGGLAVTLAAPQVPARLRYVAWGIAGTSLASVAILAITLSTGWLQTRSTAPPSVVQLPAEPAAPWSLVETEKPAPAPTHTTLSLSELSGPELEALLDLKPAMASVSF